MKKFTIFLCSIVFATPAFAIEKCGSGQRVTCVVDGDTFWLESIKYRTFGYDTPEPMTGICGGRYEQQLAAQATARFVELWNTTTIEIQETGQRGAYNRDLVHVFSDGRNIGDILISEGLARSWPDGDEFWCR